MLDLNKKGELEFLIDFCLDQARGQCAKCITLGEPTMMCNNGILWHRVIVRRPDKPETEGWRECNASAVMRIVWEVRDRYNG